jgi:branched-chain amino acid transport system substrate-binding protein
VRRARLHAGGRNAHLVAPAAILAALACTLLPLGTSGADSAPAVPTEIKSAYDDGSREEVVDLARRFLAEYPDSSARYEVAYLAGDASWDMKDYAAVEEFLKPLLVEAPSSPRWPGAALLLARSLERRGEHFEAAEWLSRLLGRKAPKRTREDAEDDLKDLARKRLGPDELCYLAYRYRPGSVHCLIIEEAARAQEEAGRWEELRDLLDLARRECGGEDKIWDKLEASAWRGAPPLGCKDPYLVGLACPLDGPLSDYGESLKRGATIALHEHNRDSRYKYALVARTTGADPISAVAAARRIAVEDGVVCLIGGLLSSTTIAITGVASALEIPLVSPSATREGIAQAGPFVYQSSLPRLLQARALAEAARSRLEASKAAVLYPQSDDGEFFAKSFEEAFVRAGGSVVISAGYAEGETNFSAVLSSAASKAPDCVLLAGGARDLAPLIPQLSYYDLDVPVLATEAIGAGSVAELARRHLKAVLYSQDAYALRGESKTRFEAEFAARYGAAPDEFAVRGYLAFRLVAKAMDSGGGSRMAVARSLGDLVDAEEPLKSGRFLSVSALEDVEVPVVEISFNE